jgi:hypothetical protein
MMMDGQKQPSGEGSATRQGDALFSDLAGKADAAGRELAAETSRRRGMVRAVASDCTDREWARFRGLVGCVLTHGNRFDELRVAELVLREGEVAERLDRDMPEVSGRNASSVLHNLVDKCAHDVAIFGWVSSVHAGLASVPLATGGDVRWALGRLSEEGRRELIGLIPRNTAQVEGFGGERDRELAEDLFIGGLGMGEASAKYGKTEEGLGATVVRILDIVSRRPKARRIVSGLRDEELAAPPSSQAEVRKLLRMLPKEAIAEVVDGIPNDAWHGESSKRLHTAVLREYFASRLGPKAFLDKVNPAGGVGGAHLTEKALKTILERDVPKIAREGLLVGRLRRLASGEAPRQAGPAGADLDRRGFDSVIAKAVIDGGEKYRIHPHEEEHRKVTYFTYVSQAMKEAAEASSDVRSGGERVLAYVETMRTADDAYAGRALTHLLDEYIGWRGDGSGKVGPRDTVRFALYQTLAVEGAVSSGLSDRPGAAGDLAASVARCYQIAGSIVPPAEFVRYLNAQGMYHRLLAEKVPGLDDKAIRVSQRFQAKGEDEVRSDLSELNTAVCIAAKEMARDWWEAFKAKYREKAAGGRAEGDIEFLDHALRGADTSDPASIRQWPTRTSAVPDRILTAIAKDAQLRGLIASASAELNAVGEVDRDSFEWAMHRMPLDSKRAVLGMVRLNPRTQDPERDIRLAADAYEAGMRDRELAAKYGLKINGLRAASDDMVAQLLGRPRARKAVKAYLDEAAAVKPMGPAEIVDKLRRLQQARMDEVVEAMHPSAWRTDEAATAHKRYLLDYLVGGLGSSADAFSREYVRDRRLKVSAEGVEKAIKSALEKLSEEPALIGRVRHYLGEAGSHPGYHTPERIIARPPEAH